jgi:Prokaryotic lipoprotein-attachment site
MVDTIISMNAIGSVSMQPAHGEPAVCLPLLRLLALLIACTGCAACGQKGPLTLPKGAASAAAASAPS